MRAYAAVSTRQPALKQASKRDVPRSCFFGRSLRSSVMWSSIGWRQCAPEPCHVECARTHPSAGLAGRSRADREPGRACGLGQFGWTLVSTLSFARAPARPRRVAPTSRSERSRQVRSKVPAMTVQASLARSFHRCGCSRAHAVGNRVRLGAHREFWRARARGVSGRDSIHQDVAPVAVACRLLFRPAHPQQ